MNHTELREILLKKDRTPEELATLKGFLGRNKFFSQLFDEHKNQPEIIWGIVKALKHKVLDPFTMVFQQGDKGDQAYIVIEGKIIVSIKEDVDMFANIQDQEKIDNYSKNIEIEKKEEKDLIFKQINTIIQQIKQHGTVNNPQLIQSQNKQMVSELKKHQLSIIGKTFQTTENPIFHQFLQEHHQKSLSPEDKNLFEKISQEQFINSYEKEFGKIILELGQNSFFGEKALVENKPRAATICTLEKTDFMILEKTDFEVVIQEFKQIQAHKNQFLVNLFPIFNSLVTSGKTFERIVRFFNEDLTYRKQVIIKEGEPFNNHNAKVFMVQDGEFQIFKRIKITMYSNRQLPHQVNHQICLGTLVSGEFFGEEILQNDEGQYEYTVQCTSSQGKIMFLERNVLIKKLPEQIKEVILKKWQPKNSYRQELFLQLSEKKETEEIEERKQAEIILKQKGIKNKIQQYQHIYSTGGDQHDIDESLKTQQMQQYKSKISQNPQNQNQNQIQNQNNDSYQIMNNLSNTLIQVGGINSTNIKDSNNINNNQSNNFIPNQTSELSGILAPLNFTIDQQNSKLQDTIINNSKALQDTIDESGLTAIMMTNNQKHVLKQDFKQLVNPDLPLKHNYLSQKLIQKKQIQQKIDPFPFISKEATVIRALKEQNQNKNKRINQNNLHTAENYNQIARNFNTVKNNQNYQDFLNHSLEIQDHYIQTLHLQQQQQHSPNANKNQQESKFTYIPNNHNQSQDNSQNSQLQPQINKLMYRISKTRQNDIEYQANKPNIYSSVYQSNLPPLKPKLIQQNNNTIDIDNTNLNNSNNNVNDISQNLKQELIQQQQINKIPQVSEYSTKNKFLATSQRSQSPNLVQQSIKNFGWNNTSYSKSFSPVRVDKIDMRVGRQIIQKKLPQINRSPKSSLNNTYSSNMHLIGQPKLQNTNNQQQQTQIKLRASLQKKQKLQVPMYKTIEQTSFNKINESVSHEKSKSLDNSKNHQNQDKSQIKFVKHSEQNILSSSNIANKYNINENKSNTDIKNKTKEKSRSKSKSKNNSKNSLKVIPKQKLSISNNNINNRSRNNSKNSNTSKIKSQSNIQNSSNQKNKNPKKKSVSGIKKKLKSKKKENQNEKNEQEEEKDEQNQSDDDSLKQD